MLDDLWNKPDGLVKIDGLRNVQSALWAADAGADMVGFILAESRRQVGLDVVKEARLALESRSARRTFIVGVTVNSTAQDIQRAVESVGIDLVQLSGDEDSALLDDIDVPVMKTLHVAPGMDIDRLRRTADSWLSGPRSALALIIDAKVPGHYGGTGARADWDIAARLAAEFPVILAGGLDPDNVGQGIESVLPRGVDVSSGVEREGVKSADLTRRFVTNARAAFKEMEGTIERDSTARSRSG